MSIEQYQRTVNALDKDIADLEKKKAALDKKAAEEQRKAANITINKNASTATVRSKLQQRDNYLAAANKASGESATLANKIADKRKKRNDAQSICKKKKLKLRKSRIWQLNRCNSPTNEGLKNYRRSQCPLSCQQVEWRKALCQSMMCLFPTHGRIKRNSLMSL